MAQKLEVTYDTRRFVFQFSSPEKRMWLPWGRHINLAVELPDRMVVRPYTPVKPILPLEDNGTFELMIKVRCLSPYPMCCLVSEFKANVA